MSSVAKGTVGSIVVEVNDLELAALHDACSGWQLELPLVVYIVCDIKPVKGDALIAWVVYLSPTSVVP